MLVSSSTRDRSILVSHVHQPLRGGDAERCVLRDLTGDLQRALDQLSRRHDFEHQAQRKRLSGIDAPYRRDDLQRSLRADRRLQQERQAAVYGDTALDLRGLENDVLGADPEIRGQREPETRANGVAIDRADDRHVAVAHGQDRRCPWAGGAMARRAWPR